MDAGKPFLLTYVCSLKERKGAAGAGEPRIKGETCYPGRKADKSSEGR